MQDIYFRVLFDNCPDGIILTTYDGETLDANPAACSMLGMTVGDIKLAGREGILFPDDNVNAATLQRKATGGFKGEVAYVRKDGTIFPVDLTCTVFEDRCLIIFRDISESKRIQEEQRHLQEQLEQRVDELETIMRVVPVAIWLSNDPECRVVVGNRLANGYYEAAEGENVSASITTDHKYYRDGVEVPAGELPMQRSVATGQEIHGAELEIVNTSGKRVTLLGSTIPLRDSEGGIRGCISAAMDITGMKRLEKQSQSLFRERIQGIAQIEAVFNTLPTSVVVFDEAGRIVRMNPAARTSFRPMEGNGQLRSSGDILEAFRPMDEEGTPLVPGEVPVNRALAGEMVSGKVIMIHLPDGRTRWTINNAAPIRLEDGTIIGAVTSFEDMTEVRELHERSEKLSRTKDEFLAICSHEMKTPLTVMLASVELLQNLHDRMTPEKRNNQLNTLKLNTKRLNLLVSDLLDWSRLQTGSLSITWTDLNPCTLLNDTLNNFMNGCPTHILERRISLDRAMIKGDEGRLVQVFNNLLSNAVRYSEKGTPILVTAVSDGGHACISISDQGSGIKEEDKGHLFERYFRGFHAHDSSGLGLGLYITSEIIKAHGGSITVESQLGRGSTFTVRLPLCG